MANSQKAQALKLELLVPIIHEDHPTACASLNLHHDHFSQTFGITFDDGSPVHTGCLGLGLERLTLVLVQVPRLRHRRLACVGARADGS